MWNHSYGMEWNGGTGISNNLIGFRVTGNERIAWKGFLLSSLHYNIFHFFNTTIIILLFCDMNINKSTVFIYVTITIIVHVELPDKMSVIVI